MTERGRTKTVKIYDTEPLCMEFRATVTDCRPIGEGRYETVTDRTAFFPTGGGQPCDTGVFLFPDGRGGTVPVREVGIEGEVIVHVTEGSFAPGTEVIGRLDRRTRLERMAAHSGEHIVSSLIFRRYGLHNVGFHMGSEDVTADFDGTLTREQLAGIETLANEAVRDNLPVTVRYPAPEELAGMAYRSKLELGEAVRIVCIGDLDRCACCAPHVPFTGQIGLIRITDVQHYKGGIRVHMLCGGAAFEALREEAELNGRLCAMLSSRPQGLPEAVGRLEEENKRLSGEIAALNDLLNEAILTGMSGGAPCLLFDGREDMTALRKLALAAAARCAATVGVFGGREGSYRFVIAGQGVREPYTRLAARIACRGGGSDTMICGTASAGREELERSWRETFGAEAQLTQGRGFSGLV